LLKRRCKSVSKTMTKTNTLRELLKELSNILTPISQELAHREAQEIIEYILKLNYSQIQLKLNTIVSSDNFLASTKIAIERVKSGKPLPYILESGFFYSKMFNLSDKTLIPRHDTEHLIEAILSSEGSNSRLFLELGTGSGIIPEILTSERENWQGVSVDIEEDTLLVAQKNISSKVTIVVSDKFSSIVANNKFDFIVSNPPYIPTKVVNEELDISVREFEPLIALDGGDDGLEFYRYLAQESAKYLKSGGYIYLEIGHDQGEIVPAIFREYHFHNIRVINDLANRSRVVSCRAL